MPSIAIDWSHWERLDEWSIGDAVCLLLSIDPKSSLGEDLTSGDIRRSLDRPRKRLLDEYEKLYELATASIHQGRLLIRRSRPGYGSMEVAGAYVTPTNWLAWAKDKNLKIPAELQTLLMQLEKRNRSPSAITLKQTAASGREQTTFLNIIGALLELMLEKNSQGKAFSSFKNQAAIIEAIEARHRKPGLSKRSLEDKFAAAKRQLDSA